MRGARGSDLEAAFGQAPGDDREVDAAGLDNEQPRRIAAVSIGKVKRLPHAGEGMRQWLIQP
jgi:hypothetical protein